MDLSTITAQDFKDNFFRDFPYLITWQAADTYVLSNEVYYLPTKQFYRCAVASTTDLPTVTASWTLIVDEVFNYVLDADIAKAFAEAKIVFNQGLFGTDDEITLGYLYLTAHYLANDINAAQQGVAGAGSFSVASRSVGNVSESYAIPEAYTSDPILAFFAKSSYGLKYLSLVMPKLVGNMIAIGGTTQP